MAFLFGFSQRYGCQLQPAATSYQQHRRCFFDGVAARALHSSVRQSGTSLQGAAEVLHFKAADAGELECPECAVLMDCTATAEAKCKARVHEERDALKTLINVALLHLEDGERYALLPQWWLSAWRRWISSSPWKTPAADAARGEGTRSGTGSGGKAAAAAEAAVSAGAGAAPKAGVQLPALDSAMKDVTTRQSGQLRMLLEPPSVQMQRGKWSQVWRKAFANTVPCSGYRGRLARPTWMRVRAV